MDLLISILIIFISSIFIHYYLLNSLTTYSPKHVKDNKFRFYLTLFIASFYSLIITILYDIFSSSFSVSILVSFGVLSIFSWYFYRRGALTNDYDYLKQIMINNSNNIYLSKKLLDKVKKESNSEVDNNHDESVLKLVNHILKKQTAQTKVIHYFIKQSEL
jgi:hypothetical protein